MTVQGNTGPGQCSICNHPAVTLCNQFLKEGKVQIDAVEYRTSTSLCDCLAKKYPHRVALRPYHFTRHKKHLDSFEQGIAVIMKDNRLYRPAADGEEMMEIRQIEPEIALKMIISIGLDGIVSGRIRLGAKSVVDAIKIYSDIMQGKGDNDDYDKIVADRLKGRVVDVTPKTQDELLDAIPIDEIPDDIALPEIRSELNEDEDGDE